MTLHQTSSSSMRALVFRPPGGFENLKFSESFPAPQQDQLKAGEVLIKVAAAGVIHPELFWPVYQAKDGSWPERIVCPDFSGIIAAVSPDVSEFAIGDEIMAVSSEVDAETGVRKYQGGAADFAVAPVGAVFKKPWNISLPDAASIPLCALTAWQALTEQANDRVKSGAEVLITGAGGATGLWAVQIAKFLGARVTATASDAKGIALLQDLKVDNVINYKNQSLKACGRKFDVVLDAVGGQTFKQCIDVVKKAEHGGILISLVEFWASSETPEDIMGSFFIWRLAKDQMNRIVKLVEEGKLRPLIDACFPLERGVDAFLYAAKGHCHGKVVIKF